MRVRILPQHNVAFLEFFYHVTKLFKLAFVWFCLILAKFKTKFCGTTIFMLYALLESIDLMLLILAIYG